MEQFTQTLKPSCLWPRLLCCLQKNKPKWKFLSVGVYLMFHYHSCQTSSWPLVKCGLNGNFHLETGCLPVIWGPLPWQHEQRLHWRSQGGPLLFSTRYCNYPLIIILLLLLIFFFCTLKNVDGPHVLKKLPELIKHIRFSFYNKIILLTAVR